MLCEFGEEITMRIISTPPKSRTIVNYFVVWQINNLYTNRVVGFLIIKHVSVMGWFLKEENKNVINYTKFMTLFQNLNLVLYSFLFNFFFLGSRLLNVNDIKMITCNSYYYTLCNKINYVFSHLTKYTNFR